jgi:hypothetical protein
MATENILIKFTSDTSGIKDSITEMQKLGKITEEDAKKFQMMEGIAEGVADALKEAGIEAKTLNKEVKGVADSGKSLRTQFSEAKNEAVKLSNQFGAFSKEAITAAKKAALLKDEIADMNDTLDALNPEAKLNAFVKLGQGIQGGFQAATGALQVFGVENERITKLAQQFQGVLNLTQGINSVLQLKDVYGQLRVVLGVTTTAQKGLNAAMVSNPFGAVAVAIAALVAAMIILEDKTVQYTLSEEKLNKIKQDGIDATDGLKDAEDALAIQRDKNATFNIQRGKALKDLEKELFDLKLNQIEAERLVSEATKDVSKAQKEANEAAEDGNQLLFLAKTRVLEERKERLASAIDLKKQTDEAIENRKKEFLATRELITLKEIDARKQETIAKNQKKVQEETLKFMKELGLESALTNDEIIKISDDAFKKLSVALEIVDANAFSVKDAIVKINDELNNLQAISTTIATTATELNAELFKRVDKEQAEFDQKRREDITAYVDFAFQAYNSLSNSIQNIQDQQYANDLNNLKASRDAGYLTEKQYADRVNALKAKQFEENKKFQIATALMNTAQGILNALTVTPAELVPAAIALATAIGALNIARIQSVEPPSFKKGTLNFKGGNYDSDGGRMAILHPNEAVIPADRNKDYHPTIKALFNRQIKPSEINSFVQMKLQGKIPNSINAKIDHNKLGKMMRGSGVVELGNARAVGKEIAKELNKNVDIRRW